MAEWAVVLWDQATHIANKDRSRVLAIESYRYPRLDLVSDDENPYHFFLNEAGVIAVGFEPVREVKKPRYEVRPNCHMAMLWDNQRGSWLVAARIPLSKAELICKILNEDS